MTIAKRIQAQLQGDRAIWAIVAVLALFSVLAVYSATGSLAFKQRGGDTEAYLVKHGLIVGFGVILTYIFHLVHYMRFNKAAPWLMMIAIPMLVYTIAMGEEINNARRWIEVPFIGLTLQTSDFAKIALILFVAREIAKHKEYIKDFNSAFLPIIIPILIIVGLIAPADLSTALMLFFTCMLMMFIGRVSIKYIGLLILCGVVVFAGLIVMGEFFPDFIRVETWVSRVNEFANNPDGGFQVQHAKMAIANGELFGVLPGNSIMRNYLPAPYSDFIYAIIMEEYGLIGGFLIMGLYIFLLFRATALVTKSQKSFGAMAALGLSLMLVIQALANMAVSVNLVPVTGLTLPMISMGGTSVIFTCIAFGIILSVSKYIERQVENEEAMQK